MENQKKHIEFHIDIDKEADQLNVQIVAEKPTVIEPFECYLSTVSSAASIIADITNEDEQKVLRAGVAMNAVKTKCNENTQKGDEKRESTGSV